MNHVPFSPRLARDDAPLPAPKGDNADVDDADEKEVVVEAREGDAERAAVGGGRRPAADRCCCAAPIAASTAPSDATEDTESIDSMRWL